MKNYAETIKQAEQSPQLLADLLGEMSVSYSNLSYDHIALKQEKARFIVKAKFYYTEDGIDIKREKPLSDKGVESRWRVTEDGKKEYQLSQEIKLLEKLMSNIRSILSQRKAEQQNLNY